MAKRLDWEAENRRKRAQRNGTELAYREFHPTGSRADQSRFAKIEDRRPSKTLIPKAPGRTLRQPGISGTKRPSQALLLEVRRERPVGVKRKFEVRVRQLLKTLGLLVAITRKPRWDAKGPAYQLRLLEQIGSILKKLHKLDPSNASDSLIIEARRLLDERRDFLDAKR